MFWHQWAFFFFTGFYETLCSPHNPLCFSLFPLGLNFISTLTFPVFLPLSRYFLCFSLSCSSSPRLFVLVRRLVPCYVCVCVFEFSCVAVYRPPPPTARPFGQPILEATAQYQQPQSDPPIPGHVTPPIPATRTDAAHCCSR